MILVRDDISQFHIGYITYLNIYSRCLDQSNARKFTIPILRDSRT